MWWWRGGGVVAGGRAVSCAKMWRWAVLWWQVTSVLFVGATLDFRYFIRKQHLPTTQTNCFDYPTLNDRNGRAISEGWHLKEATMMATKPTSAYPTFPLLNTNEIMARRMDSLLPNAEDIVKEHAKLVQDINSLRHVVFVSPFADDNRDYDESVLQEIIEISSTPRPLPKVTSPRPPPKPTKSSSFPIILLGGASQPDIVKTQPMKFSKPISLVGSSVTPLMKHPYPFVMHGTSQRPFKFCLNPMHSMMYTTTQRPSLLQRLLSSILPRGIGR